MTPHDAAKILELPSGATSEQIETRFLELRRKLEDKIAKAPTPGLQAKYRESLDEITRAFETLTLAADSSALPMLKRQETEGRSQDSGERPAASSLSPSGGSATSKLKVQNRKSSREFAIVALIAVLVLGVGGWFVLKSRAENAEKERIAAELKVAEERASAEQQRRAEELKLEQERMLVALRGRLAELNVVHDSMAGTERAAERTLAELRSKQRDLSRGDGVESLDERALTRQIVAQSHFLDWLRSALPAHPASIARARAAELVAARATEPANLALNSYRDAIDRLKKEIELGTPDLEAIVSRVQGEPILANWKKLLEEEERKDLKIAKVLPQGATPWNADRNLATYLIKNFETNPAGMPADFPAAMAWLESAAGQGGDFGAMLLIAGMYLSSDRVPHDEETMWLWRSRAADAGDAETKYQVATVGIMQTLPWDWGTKIGWLRQAAETGHVQAQFEMGSYMAGVAAPEAFLSGTEEEVRTRAAAGSIWAQMELRMLEVAGKVLVTEEEGVNWLRKAAAQGSKEARDLLDSRGISPDP